MLFVHENLLFLLKTILREEEEAEKASERRACRAPKGGGPWLTDMAHFLGDSCEELFYFGKSEGRGLSVNMGQAMRQFTAS